MKEFLAFDKEVAGAYCLLVLVVSIYLTIRLKFPQFRFLLLAFKIFTGAMDHKGLKGQLVHSQAFFASTSSSLYFGAIIGSAFALAVGGVGALFWIWVGSLLSMPLRIATSTLAIRFRTVLPNGRYLAGPMYFIEKALRARWLAIVFSIATLFAVLALGSAVPAVTMSYIIKNATNLKGMGFVFVLAGLLLYVVLGGIRRVGRVSAFIVPFGILSFLIFYFVVYDDQLISFSEFIRAVFHNALSLGEDSEFSSVVAIIGQCVGIFFLSTETGMGKSAGISGVVRTDSPFKQGLVLMLSRFFEGIIISTMTFYVLYSYNAVNISDQTFFLFNLFNHGGHIGSILLLSSFLFLGFSAITGWFYIGEQGAYYVLGEKFANFFRILFIAVIFAIYYIYIEKGNQVLYPIFNIAYTSALITSIPVLISLILLGRMVSQEMNKYITEGGAKYEVFKDFYILLLSILPKNLISKLFGLFTYIKLPRFMMIPILKAFAKIYKINVDEAELSIREYHSLNQFFTRALKAGARIIDSLENAAVAPVDARVTSFGDINESTLIQAKGIDYSLRELLGSEKFYPYFVNGKFITFYLSPQDYHRIHSPFFGKILGYYYEPGKLFPVNDMAVEGIKGLFPKNERLITFIQTEYGKIAMVKVGASNVGKIRVTYDTKIVTNRLIRTPKEYEYSNVDIMIQKGAELGRFEMGSTVILIFEKDTIDLIELVEDEKYQYGTTIGFFRKKTVSLFTGQVKN